MLPLSYFTPQRLPKVLVMGKGGSSMAEGGASGSAGGDAKSFNQAHNELVLEDEWWWAVHLTLCAVAVIGNLLFIVTIIYNR